MNLKTFEQFLSESEQVKLDKDLREYVLTHKSDSLFQVKSKDFFREFSVVPFGSEITKALPEVHKNLEKAIETLNVNELYSSIKKAEVVRYDYGNIFTSEFTLDSVPELTVTLQPEQLDVLNTSEREFLLNNFSQLNRESKDLIISALRERAEILCVVIEALFYYMRAVDTENFYQRKNQEEILEDYQEAVDKAAKEVSFSVEGPFSDTETRSEINPDTETAYWVCEKNTQKFLIRATISPKELKAEENVGGTTGLKFSLSGLKDKSLEKDYNFFGLPELASRAKLFYDKVLK
jgi:hypothetical protein